MTTYKDKLTSLTLIPSDGGRFELSVDGELRFSKLAEDRFPEWDEIKSITDAAVA